MTEGEYSLVLTHDVDDFSLREIPVSSRTFWGFAYRNITMNFRRYRRGDLDMQNYLKSLGWACATPLVKAGIVCDPWLSSFRDMIEIERSYGVRSTLFFISIPRDPGHNPDGTNAPSKRSGYYRLEDWKQHLLKLHSDGWELGVHGIDCHVSVESARRELYAFSQVLGINSPGLRMHWLYSTDSLRENAKKAGFAYDSTLGWNDRIGFPEGRLQPFIDRETGLPILPLNIQDAALLGEWRQGLNGSEAWQKVSILMDEAKKIRGVLTILWHSTSYGPPRFWSDIYVRILEKALNDGARIIRAIDAVQEFASNERG
jgi:hypothetical protein